MLLGSAFDSSSSLGAWPLWVDGRVSGARSAASGGNRNCCRAESVAASGAPKLSELAITCDASSLMLALSFLSFDKLGNPSTFIFLPW